MNERALQLVRACFGAEVVRRALAHVSADRVHLVKAPPWPVVARVDGHVVTVHHEPAVQHLRAECSCEADGDCEHAAATALVVLARERELAAERALAARQEAVGAWLAELGRDEVGPIAPPRDDRAIAYVLDARDGLGLTVVQCTRLRSGELGGAAVLASLADPARGAPAWVGLDDLRRIAMLRAVSRTAPQVARMRVDRIGAELLRELADGGVLHWDRPQGPPLAWGAAIATPLGWREDGEDLRLGVDGALVVVPARETLYVDPAAATIGLLDVGVAPGVLGRLLAAPPVPRAMRPAVDRSLRALLAADEPASDGEPMRPRLFAAVGADGALELVAEAEYGEDRYPLGAWDARRPAPRDLVAEGRCRARLDTLLAALPHRGEPASSLELLADARHVAQELVPALRAEGWRCELADDFPHEAPRSDVTFVERLQPIPEARDWFALELGVVIDGREVPLLPLLVRALREGALRVGADGTPHVTSGLTVRLPEGEQVHVPADRVARWIRPLVEHELRAADDRDALRVPTPVAAELELPARELSPARERLAALVDLAPRAEPPGFAGTLRAYQRTGLAWLRCLHDAGHGGVLADEMGLGKTVQVLAFLEELRAEGALREAPALVVAPRSLLGTWHAEALRFAPALAPAIHLGAERADAPAALAASPLVITSYQTLVRDRALFEALRWTTAIFDEAHALKNPDTQLRRAAAAIAARSRFAITGTPIENHLGELWSQLDLAVPGLLGRRRGFDAVFRRPIEKFGATAPLERLRQRTRPFLLRRRKAEVDVELPPRSELIEWIDLEPAQRDLYESLRLTLDGQVRAALAARGVHGASMTILDALLKLRQCCCDPRLVKLPEARRVTASAKLERLTAMLEELADSGRATLVFSQFTSMLALIERACARLGVPTLVLTGETRDRDDVVRRFQAGEAPVLLASLKAGGVGLNLTRAETVIHYDPWWNPAVEAQATARAHRIGQERRVIVYKLVARGTVEESICSLQDDKRQLTEAALRDADARRLAPEDLAALYQRVS